MCVLCVCSVCKPGFHYWEHEADPGMTLVSLRRSNQQRRLLNTEIVDWHLTFYEVNCLFDVVTNTVVKKAIYERFTPRFTFCPGAVSTCCGLTCSMNNQSYIIIS